MNLLELVPLGFATIGVAFGFGKQSMAIAHLRRDVDNIAKLHRTTIDLLSDVDKKLVRIDERVDGLRQSQHQH